MQFCNAYLQHSVEKSGTCTTVNKKQKKQKTKKITAVRPVYNYKIEPRHIHSCKLTWPIYADVERQVIGYLQL